MSDVAAINSDEGLLEQPAVPAYVILQELTTLLDAVCNYRQQSWADIKTIESLEMQLHVVMQQPKTMMALSSFAVEEKNLLVLPVAQRSLLMLSELYASDASAFEPLLRQILGNYLQPQLDELWYLLHYLPRNALLNIASEQDEQYIDSGKPAFAVLAYMCRAASGYDVDDLREELGAWLKHSALALQKLALYFVGQFSAVDRFALQDTLDSLLNHDDDDLRGLAACCLVKRQASAEAVIAALATAVRQAVTRNDSFNAKRYIAHWVLAQPLADVQSGLEKFKAQLPEALFVYAVEWAGKGNYAEWLLQKHCFDEFARITGCIDKPAIKADESFVLRSLSNDALSWVGWREHDMAYLQDYWQGHKDSFATDQRYRNGQVITTQSNQLGQYYGAWENAQRCMLELHFETDYMSAVRNAKLPLFTDVS